MATSNHSCRHSEAEEHWRCEELGKSLMTLGTREAIGAGRTHRGGLRERRPPLQRARRAHHRPNGLSAWGSAAYNSQILWCAWCECETVSRFGQLSGAGDSRELNVRCVQLRCGRRSARRHSGVRLPRAALRTAIGWVWAADESCVLRHDAAADKVV
jgi:hypothetical protein